MLEKLFALAGTSPNELVDGRHRCSYPTAWDIIRDLNERFAILGLGDPREPVALTCENTLPGALTLLALLAGGRSVVLLSKASLDPRPGAGSGHENNGPPRFCRYIVNPAESMATTDALVRFPAHLHARANPKYTADPCWPDADPTLMLRTSGSTGAPKWVVHRHADLLANAGHCVARLGLSMGDRIAIPVPLFHMYGLGAAFLPAVLAGAAVDLQAQSNLLVYLEHERAFNPNVAFMTPIFCETLVKGRRASRPYRLTVLAGDRVRESGFWQYQAAFGPLVQLYGSTEMGALAAADPQLADERRCHTAGRPMPDVAIRIEREATLDHGAAEAGALWCRRDCGFAYYLDAQGRPIADEAMRADGWFHTKDRVARHADGCLEILGRADHCINRDGLLVAFAEVEQAIERLPEIERVVVASQGEGQRGKRLIACCLVRPGATLTNAAIERHCLAHLPARAVPDEIRLVAALPTLANGKVDRQAVAQAL